MNKRAYFLIISKFIFASFLGCTELRRGQFPLSVIINEEILNMGSRKARNDSFSFKYGKRKRLPEKIGN